MRPSRNKRLWRDWLSSCCPRLGLSDGVILTCYWPLVVVLSLVVQNIRLVLVLVAVTLDMRYALVHQQDTVV